MKMMEQAKGVTVGVCIVSLEIGKEDSRLVGRQGARSSALGHQ